MAKTENLKLGNNKEQREAKRFAYLSKAVVASATDLGVGQPDRRRELTVDPPIYGVKSGKTLDGVFNFE